MDYLRGNATASAVGLFVLCDYLSGFQEGRTEGDVVAALRVLRRSAGSSDDSGAVLRSSLKVGQDLGFISNGDHMAPLKLNPDLAADWGLAGEGWPWFRRRLLTRIAQHGIDELEGGRQAPDLVLGLAWFLQLNPLEPPGTSWTGGVEGTVRSLGFEAVSNSEQWRAFQRWAVALGLARRMDQGDARVLIPDASTAISDQRPHMPAGGRAKDWLAELRRCIPVLGDKRIVDELPQGGPVWNELPPGVVFGLLKLERRGVLVLAPTDDDSDVVAIGVGETTRQVGRISFGSSDG